MRKMLGSLLKAGAVCGMLMVMNPFTSLAAIGPGFTAGTYVATITAESVNINKSQDSEEVLMTAKTGNVYEVLEDMGNGWMKVRVNDSEGFLPVSGNATVEQVGENEMAEVQQDAVESSDTYKRQQNSAGISMNRSSGGQAQQGIAISADQMRPGDLIFYGSGRSINHVAMYIGNGQIVHASTERTGITVSNWDYRNPVKIVNVLG